MICNHCKSEISDDARFCPECGLVVSKPESTDILTPETVPSVQGSDPVPASDLLSDPGLEQDLEPDPAMPPVQAFVPVSSSLNNPGIEQQPASPAPLSPAAPVIPTLTAPNPQAFFAQQPEIYDESGYYHVNAAEVYDFEAMRGISILLIILSAISVVGVIFPMPLAVITLVKACGGIGERNTTAAASRFSTCKILTIVTICTLLLFVIAGAILVVAMGYLSKAMDMQNLLF